MKWSEVTFESLYSVPSRNGIYKPKEFHGSGCRMVNMGELFGFDFLGWQEMERVELTEAELELSGLIDGDLLFGRRSLVEAGAGKCSIVVGPTESLSFESSIIRVRLDKEKANPRFYFYFFTSPEGRGRIRSIASGTNVKGIRGSDLKTLKVAVPPLTVQDKIVDVLSAYDDLIENNQRRMELLEETARLLYREWFVRLRFPGHEHTHIAHGVPEGWEFKPIGEVATLNYGKALKEENRLEGTVPVYGSSGVVGSHSEALVTGPGIVVGRKGNVGNVFWSDIPFWPIDTVYFVSPEESSLFLFHCLRQVSFQNSDVAVPGLNRTYAHSLKILMPSPRLRVEFEETIAPMFEHLTKLRTMNQKLRAARGLLLPRLMSGEIAV